MAPELYEESYGIEVDIYAFGMALLEMLTREAPYRECNNPAQIYKKVVSHKLPNSLERILDDQVKRFILVCIENDKSKRPTAEQLLHSEFLTDTTSENNEKPCEVHEAKKMPKQKHFKPFPLPEIRECDEGNAEDMDIKTENKGFFPPELDQAYN